MKFTVDKPKQGYTQVRGGRFLRVVKDHRVSVDTWDRETDDLHTKAANPGMEISTLDGKPPRYPAGATTVVAKAGDLAVEIINTRFMSKVGVAYISGSAMALATHGKYPEDWFEDTVDARRVDLTSKDTPRTANEIVAALLRCKYAPCDVVLMRISASGLQELAGMAEFAYFVMGMCAEASLGLVQRADVLVILSGPRDTGYGTIHMQPPTRHSEWPVQPFQMELAHGSKQAKPWDCWDGAAFEREVGSLGQVPSYDDICRTRGIPTMDECRDGAP